jgi:hypothetical protein
MHKLPPLAGWPTQTSIVHDKGSPLSKSGIKKKRTSARRQKKGALKQENAHD